MADRTSTMTAVLVDAVSGPARTIRAEITGIGESVSRTTALLQGIGQGIGQQVFFALREGISAVARAIPDLLDQGHAYLAQLQQIQLETGMTAEQASTLVGALRSLGVPTEDLDTLFARLGRNIGANEGLFRQLGVATRDQNGALLSSYTIFQNIRRAVSEHGESLLSTSAAQEIFGRSGGKLIEALQASDAEWQAATENVRRWGGVVSQAAVAGADRLGDTLASLAQGITDIGVNIASAVDPYLRAFVDSFATFVQSHLNEIVNFAVAVVNTVTGFISGLFGITSALDVTSSAVADSTKRAAVATGDFGKTLSTAAGGADAFTKATQAQIKAIDAHTAALQQAADRRRAIQERARLADSLAAAQAQLADLRGNAPFTEGLSSSEAVLARQKHAQDIIDAERDVADKRQAIGDFDADQRDRAERELASRQKARLQENLADHKAANAAILQSGLQMNSALDKDTSTVLGNLGIRTQEFGKTASASFQTGIDAARGFLDILLGSEHAATGPHDPAGRTGGVVGALGSLGGAIGGLGLTVDGVARAISDAITTIDEAFKPLSDILNWILGLEQSIRLNLPSFVQGVLDGDRAGSGRGGGGGGFATGGYIPPTPGGRLIRAAEGGEGEWVIPQSKMGWGGKTTYVTFQSIWPPTAQQAREIRDWIDEQLDIVADNVPVGLVGFRAGG